MQLEQPNARGERRATRHRHPRGKKPVVWPVRCRVEPMVTHPAPTDPHVRKARMQFLRQSRRYPDVLSRGAGDTLGERSVSLVYRPHQNAPPDVACPPVARLGLTAPRAAGRCDATPATWPSQGPALGRAGPDTVGAPHVRGVPRGLVGWSKRPDHARALGHPVPPCRDAPPGDRGLSHVPAFPRGRHAPLSAPAGGRRTGPPAPRPPAFQPLDPVGFPPRDPFRGSLTRPPSSRHPAPYGPCQGGTRVRSCPVGSTFVRKGWP